MVRLYSSCVGREVKFILEILVLSGHLTDVHGLIGAK